MSDYLWLKIGVSAAVGGFCLWKLTSTEDETIQQLTNTQKLYMDMTLSDAPPTDDALQSKMKQLLATAEEQFVTANYESGVKYMATGVGIAAILGSQSNASQLAVTLYQQFAPGLPKASRDELLSSMHRGSEISLNSMGL